MQTMQDRAALLKWMDDEVSKSPHISQVHLKDHVLRVWMRAEVLGRRLGADMDVLYAACILHDLGRHHGLEIHGEKSADLAKPILSHTDLGPERTDKVLDAIAKHDYTTHASQRKTIESKILYDCDKMDAFGAVGVKRHIIFMQQDRMKLKDVIPSLDMRYKGLTLEESRNLALEEYRYIRGFFTKLMQEECYFEDQETASGTKD